MDVVVSNPPYIQVADGMRSDNLEKMIARHELKATLGDFVNCAARSSALTPPPGPRA